MRNGFGPGQQQLFFTSGENRIYALDARGGKWKWQYDREAPAEDVANLKLLRGHLKQGQFITKIRKVFARDEMADDLVFGRARVAGQDDNIEYVSILPTSPP